MSNSHSKGRHPNSKLATRSEADGSRDRGDDAWRAQLSPEQYRVLRQKGTENANSHAYGKLYAAGNYHCAGCDTLLYTSEMKFDCGCGWPGFWTNVDMAVREEPEINPQRPVEIVCNACNGHLGHVFRNERHKNPTNERHCVNGTSLKFVPAL